MNLVIDDAVEVQQVTKLQPQERRRQLGRLIPRMATTLTQLRG